MKSVSKKDEAVSPVIGTILLVAITVVLVAIVAAVVMGMVGGIGQSKTVGVTVVPFANTTTTGITLTLTGGPDAGSVTDITAYMEGVTFDALTGTPKIGVPILVTTNPALSTDPATGTLTLTGNFTDGSQYVIYQNKISIPSTT